MPHWRERLITRVTAECRPVDKLSHMVRLVPLTRLVGEGSAYDDDTVFAAVWLHDLGVFHGHRPEDPVQLATWDHTAYAMKCTPQILASIGFPIGKIESVVEAIRTHQAKDNPTTIEGTILRDADLLEQLGAVAVLRMASKVGRDSRFPTFDEVEVALKNQLERLPMQLRLETSKRLAEPKREAMRQYLVSFQTENEMG